MVTRPRNGTSDPRCRVNVFADLFLGEICDPVEGIRMHHREDDPLRFPTGGKWIIISHLNT
jgi:hypothetical protein